MLQFSEELAVTVSHAGIVCNTQTWGAVVRNPGLKPQWGNIGVRD